jgi:hypothetical protein
MNNISVPEEGFGYYKAVYRVSYLPPIGGTYSVRIYAKDEGPEYNVNYTFAGYFDVWGKSFGIIEQCVNNTDRSSIYNPNSRIHV